MTYTLRGDGYVIRDVDGAVIPPDGDSPARRDYEAWLAVPNTPTPAPPVPPSTLAATGRQIFSQARVQGVSAALSAFIARAGQTDASGKVKWTPWAGPRKPVC